MTKSYILDVKDISQASIERSEHVQIKGWLIANNEVHLVSDPRSPSTKIKLPTILLEKLTEQVPERLRVGGQYMWEEEVQLSGLLSHKDGGLSIDELDELLIQDAKIKISL